MDSIEEVLGWHVPEGLVDVEMEGAGGIGDKAKGVKVVFFVEEEMRLSLTFSGVSWNFLAAIAFGCSVGIVLGSIFGAVGAGTFALLLGTSIVDLVCWSSRWRPFSSCSCCSVLVRNLVECC